MRDTSSPESVTNRCHNTSRRDVLKIAALIVAAGRGSRASGPGQPPKQYADLGGQAVLTHTLRAFTAHPDVDHVLTVIHADDRHAYDAASQSISAKLLPPTIGGATRQASVLRGLDALQAVKPDLVLIHDAARPFIDAATISRVIEALDASPGALAALPIADTIKRTHDGTNTIAATVERRGLWRAQTPQGFVFDQILAAHQAAADAQRTDFTDDAAIAEWAGIRVTLVESSERNLKLTTKDDLAMAASRFASDNQAPPFETRTGTGFDVHRFEDGDHVWLCGVKIPHDKKLEGHSDADVGLHALTDALLGTIGDGDIGTHFPPSDPQWKGAASHLFLAHAAKLIAAKGGRIVNVDVTVLAEAPRIGPHRAAMQAVIGAVLQITPDRIGIKATTTEGLGFTGRREGIAAMAQATVQLPTLRP
jgi:2-C-methyl-D-erythritol 4-phosphate cytidylyltransferase / 2-C-methyl-D-erythritol 2,4-cyclodiphosphate synthase